MTRMGPRMGPTAGPLMGPNVAFGGGTDPLDGFSKTFTTSFADGQLFFADAHGLVDGDGPFQLTTTGTLPDPTQPLTDYYAIASTEGADTIRIATSRANALALTAVSLNDDGTGTHTITYVG